MGVSGRLSGKVSGYADACYEARGAGQDAFAVAAGLRVVW